MRVPLAKEGWAFVGPCAVVAGAALAWAALAGPDGPRTAAAVAGAVAAAAAAFSAWFFRDPRRSVPSAEEEVTAPADGKVMSVTAVADEPFMGGPATRIAIFLSIFDVHVQRAPVGGAVVEYGYRAGRFLAAWRPEAGAQNERASLGIATPGGPVLVRQIAGLAARRIVTYPREGDELSKGDRIGLIRFGSRVDLFLPAEWPVAVAPGDMVRGGKSTVARMKSNAR